MLTLATMFCVPSSIYGIKSCVLTSRLESDLVMSDWRINQVPLGYKFLFYTMQIFNYHFRGPILEDGKTIKSHKAY